MGRLIRWEPAMGMTRLRDEMNRLMENFFGETAEEVAPSELVRMPSLDIIDRETDIFIRADMPGIDKDKLKIEAMRDAISLHAEIKQEKEEKRENYLRRERRFGSFQRIIPLPAEIKPDEVKAQYKDGILEITLPKSDEAKSRQPVKVNIE